MMMIVAFFLFLLQNTMAAAASTSMLLTPSTVVDTINVYRTAHGAQKAAWSPTLAASAASWASTLASRNALAHSSMSYGENVAQLYARGSTVADTACAQAIAMWYGEEASYDYAAATYSPTTGHFTQVIWNASTAIGAGVATSTAGYAFVVMEFDPPGNYLGMFRQNVFPLLTVSSPSPAPIVIALSPPLVKPPLVKSPLLPTRSPLLPTTPPPHKNPLSPPKPRYSPPLLSPPMAVVAISPQPPPLPSPMADTRSPFSPSTNKISSRPPPIIIVQKQSPSPSIRASISPVSKSSPPRIQSPFRFLNVKRR